jgi:serine protease Do
LNSTRALQGTWFKPVGLAFVFLAMASGWQAHSQPAPQTLVAATLAMPAPAPDRSGELPVVFRREGPISIADLRAIQQQVEALVPRISPAVVAVELDSGSGHGIVASGSGVVITADGLVLTAGHVCESTNRNVRFEFPNGKVAHGKTLGLDEDADTGLMRITDSGPWPFAPLANLREASLGEWVLALGHPGGFDSKRSLVVRLGRVVSVAPGILQTDCTISPGDSGGPLFDIQGRVIGIHTAISSSMSENFHVPITEFYDTWQELAGAPVPVTAVIRPSAYCGARAVNGAEGCRLSAIDKGSPAAKAGLKVDDLVLKIDDRTIVAAASFERWMEEASPGQTLKLQIKRGGKLHTIKLKLE